MNTTNVTGNTGPRPRTGRPGRRRRGEHPALLTAFAGRLDEQDQELLSALKIHVGQMAVDERVAPYRPPTIVETMPAGSPRPVAGYSPPLLE